MFKGNSDDDKTNIMNLPIKVINGKIIYLHNIVALDYQESDPGSYYRINGLNRINLNVYAAKNANMIELAGRVKTEMATDGKFSWKLLGQANSGQQHGNQGRVITNP